MLSSIIAAIIPVIFISFVIYIIDTEKEPLPLLTRCFIWGMIIVIPIIFIETGLNLFADKLALKGFSRSFFDAFFVAGLTEEFFKFMALWHTLRKSKYFDQYFDGIAYSVFVSMGFALVENILYVVEHGMGTAIIRGLLSVPAHAFFAIFMGFHLSLWRIGKEELRNANLMLALFIPIILHGLFDFFLFDMTKRTEKETSIILIYIILFFSLNLWFWRAAYNRIKRHLANDRKNIENGNNQG